MKYQIRRGVFETNSSSMHSISIMGSSKIKDYDFPEILVITGGEYGWSGPSLISYKDKLNYLATEYSDSEEMLERIKKVYEDHTGSELVYDLPDEDSYLMYIDHQSYGTVNEFINFSGVYDGKTLEEALRDLIFNENKIIIIDNDN